MSFRLNKEALTDSNPLTLSNFYRLFLQLLRNNTSLPQSTVEEVLQKRGFSLNLLAGFQQALARKNSPYVFDFPSLANYVRASLRDSSPLVMTVLLPMRVIIQGRSKGPIQLPTYEQASSGHPNTAHSSQHTLIVGDVVYINEMDFHMEGEDPTFRGLAPGKVVRLKNANLFIRCEDIEFNEYGEPSALLCTEVGPDALTDSELSSVPVIEWVPEEGGIPVPLRLFNHSFNHEEASGGGGASASGNAAVSTGDLTFNEELNPENEMSIQEAIVDASIRHWMPLEGKYFQFGSLGYFVASADGQGGIIFHQTVKLHGNTAVSTVAASAESHEAEGSEDSVSDADFETPPVEGEATVTDAVEVTAQSEAPSVAVDEPAVPATAAVAPQPEPEAPTPVTEEPVRRKPTKRLVHAAAAVPVAGEAEKTPTAAVDDAASVTAAAAAAAAAAAPVEVVEQPVVDAKTETAAPAEVEASSETVQEESTAASVEVGAGLTEEGAPETAAVAPVEMAAVPSALAESSSASEAKDEASPPPPAVGAESSTAAVSSSSLNFYTPPEEGDRHRSGSSDAATKSASSSSASDVPVEEEEGDENLSVLDRRALTKQRIEHQKQARLNEAAGCIEGVTSSTSASGSLTSPVGNVAGRAEMIRRKSEIESAARVQQLKEAHTLTPASVSVAEKAFLVTKQAELDNQARLEQLKAEKLAAFLGDAAAAGGSGGGGGDGEETLSLVERTERARQQAEAERQAKLEADKKKNLTGFLATGDGSHTTGGGGDGEEQHLSLVERTERARQQAEAERQAKLEADKKKNLTGFLQKGSGTGGDVTAKPADWDSMTMAQRREAQQRQAELDKQARLKAFLGSPDPASSEAGGDASAEDSLAAQMSPGGSTQKKSIKDRFENAKRLQQQEEEQRLAKIRSNATPLSKSLSQDEVVASGDLTLNTASADGVTPERRLQRGSSVKNMWDQSLNESKAAKAAASTTPTNKTPEIRHTGTKLKENWESVLTESKQSEDSRYSSTKRQTIAQFQVTKGTGIVKKRIGEWEELFLQIAASAEQLEALLKAARLLSQSNQHQDKSIDEMKELQRKFQEDCKIPEPFIIGSTHIYNTKLLDYPIASFIKRCLGDVKTKHFSLACGVYGDQTQPPIEVYAAAIKTDEAFPNYYIALTIKAVAGKELDPNAYGVKKITVFAKEANNKVMDIVVDIIPQFGWEQWIAEGGFGADVLERFENSPSLQKILNPQGSVAVATDASAASSEKSHTPPKLEKPEDVDAAAAATAVAASTNLLSEFDDIPVVSDPAEKPQQSEVNSGHNDNTALTIHTSPFSTENTPGGALTTTDSMLVTPTTVSETVEDMPIVAVRPSDLMGVEPDEFRSSEETQEFGQSSWTIEPSSAALDTSLTLEEEQQQRLLLKQQQQQQEPQSSSTAAVGDGVADLSAKEGATAEAAEVEDEVDKEAQAELDGGDVFDASPEEEQLGGNKNDSGKFYKDIEDERLSENEPEPDADDDCADDTNEPFNFGRTLAVASVGVAREFTAAPVKKTDFEMSAHNAGKFSWSGADEVDTLPTASYTTVYFDLSEVKDVSCCSNLFVVASRESTQLFTGTMKTTTTSTRYMVHRDKIFQWIRGAAISGWCVKWPMRSQKYGRRTKRFFVLRDNILTYHHAKPADEESVLKNYSSKNSLVLTEDTTVTMTRHYFLRAMTITTPEDTLWIRFRSFRGNEIKEKRWKEELYKAVQNQTRKKLFMSLPRVESIWFHESANISIVSSDAISYEGGYSKVALFCLHTQEPEHSTDVAPKPRSSFSITSAKPAAAAPAEKVPIMRRSSKGDYLVCTNKFSVDLAMKGMREQLEVLRTNDSPFLTSNLKVVKLYGDMILLGGSNGFIGVGVPGRAPATEECPARKVIYCIPSNDSTVRTDNSPKNSSAVSVDGSFLGVNPHSKEGTIKCFAVGNKSNIFAAADSLGIISLWYLQKTAQEPSPQSKAAGKKGTVSQLLTTVKTEFQSCVNLIGMGSSGNHKGQMVISMQFMPNDTQLLVCTNKRMLILQLNTHGGRTAFSPSKPFNPDAKMSMSLDSSGNTLLGGTNAAATTTAQPTAVYGSHGSMIQNTAPQVETKAGSSPTPLAGTQYKVVGWAELDRVALGCNGVFAMYVEPVNHVPIEGAVTRSESGDAAAAAAVTVAESVSGASEFHREFGKLVQWKIVEDEPLSNMTPQTSGGHHHKHKVLSKCTVYRFQWSPAMWEAALLKMKYI